MFNRLWAEIFEVREENNEIFWGRVSDDVVPVNVVCIQDTPETTFQITAYNRLVEKIFDVYLTQPGMLNMMNHKIRSLMKILNLEQLQSLLLQVILVFYAHYTGENV